MFKFLYDIIAIKKGHFGCLPVALSGSKTSPAYALNSLASDPSPFRRCSVFLHFHSQSTSIFSGPYERNESKLIQIVFPGLQLRTVQKSGLGRFENSTLEDRLVSRSKASGPLMVAAFMQEVLTNPLSGYNMNEHVFGQAEDFITLPKISQLFGEVHEANVREIEEDLGENIGLALRSSKEKGEMSLRGQVEGVLEMCTLQNKMGFKARSRHGDM
ncbi:uncharacterized protein LOC114949575 isoform X3 [Acropora millepora]|uniref:uncharacterized protein LOC114949575 isoform X3 n=1 Tax=Acropora millepora TaxID=45264 RepID=UPI001CF2F049|nr:uncharacterized protein LOC114949575 isoform X3 [Acropora millepora]